MRGCVFLIFDFRPHWSVLLLFLLCCSFPFFEYLHFPLWNESSTRWVENSQAIMLFIGGFLTLLYVHVKKLTQAKKIFWLWAALWWIVLCGRSTSWGRDYFPEIPKIYFRLISIMLITPLVFMLFSPQLRSEIKQKFRTAVIPVWGLIFAVGGLIISDSIEHHRTLGMIFLHDLQYRNFMEELYEYPLIIGLAIISFSLLRNEHPEKKSAVQNKALGSTHLVKIHKHHS